MGVRFKKNNQTGRGGPRPGSGPKVQAVRQTAREIINGDIVAVLEEMRKHRQSPEPTVAFAACKWWAEQAIGRAKESLEITSKRDDPMHLVQILIVAGREQDVPPGFRHLIEQAKQQLSTQGETVAIEHQAR